jgi:hypothetical protein
MKTPSQNEKEAGPARVLEEPAFFWKKECGPKKTFHFLLEKRKWSKENQYLRGVYVS